MWTLKRVPFNLACVVARYISARWIDADLVCAHMKPSLLFDILRTADDRCQDCAGAFQKYESRFTAQCGCKYHAVCFVLQHGQRYSHNDVCRQRVAFNPAAAFVRV
jgi:hypothetical protein